VTQLVKDLETSQGLTFSQKVWDTIATFAKEDSPGLSLDNASQLIQILLDQTNHPDQESSRILSFSPLFAPRFL